ncbi:hypothetical protein ODZ84_02690 [Chryseobacterium fluminis]|uniref:hypothetical protein n=1 Tax=Chryseobacterium fluminis TaxID=2983606 RepID=UPI00225A2C44|nr:hypothetical protein [Chryseobacterium sp. MMS21-Ot14]UZT98496.1 hypothetical protein ODZ84_02690 [Chryseobacterium sp. MMS21-Ot14]
MKFQKKSFIETKSLSYLTVGIIILVILSVWFSGMDSHRSLFQNSIVSTSILAITFFLFISLGLFYGIKLKDNIGVILNYERIKKVSDKGLTIDGFNFEPPIHGDGFGGIIFSIILWFIFSVLIMFLTFILGVFFWVVILVFTAMLYWIFFRALRFVFKNSKHCKGNFFKSFGFGFLYSFLYVSWIYGMIFLINYLN